MAEETASPARKRTRASTRTKRTEGSSMRARQWAIAYNFREPADYGVPEVPAWTVHRDGPTIAFAENDESAPFIRADNPIRVRR